MTREVETENLPEELIVKEGETFRPFGDLEYFPGKLLLEPYSWPANTYINFEGISGNVVLQTVHDPVGIDYETPLGPVKKTEVFDNGKSRWTELPLALSINFYVKSQEALQALVDHQAEVTLGGRAYNLKLVDVDTLDKHIKNLGTHRETTVRVLLSQKGDWRKLALLPFDLELLGNIEITFESEGEE